MNSKVLLLNIMKRNPLFTSCFYLVVACSTFRCNGVTKDSIYERHQESEKGKSRHHTAEGVVTGNSRQVREATAVLPLRSNLNDLADISLKEKHHSFAKHFGGMVEFNCDIHSARAILRKYPRSSRQWVHNNLALEMENERMVYQMGVLTIQSLKAEDQGVYVCRIEYEPQQFKSVALFSLVVESNEITIRVKETASLTLQSNSAPIGYLFRSTLRAWWLNDTVMLSNVTASKAMPDVFLQVDRSYEGLWTCIVTEMLQNGKGRTWATARYTVKVVPPPTQLEMFIAFCSQHPALIVMISLGVSGFFLVLFIGCVYKADQDKQATNTEMDYLKEKLIQ